LRGILRPRTARQSDRAHHSYPQANAWGFLFSLWHQGTDRRAPGNLPCLPFGLLAKLLALPLPILPVLDFGLLAFGLFGFGFWDFGFRFAGRPARRFGWLDARRVAGGRVLAAGRRRSEGSIHPFSIRRLSELSRLSSLLSYVLLNLLCFNVSDCPRLSLCL
jgi:hypothetical protein